MHAAPRASYVADSGAISTLALKLIYEQQEMRIAPSPRRPPAILPSFIPASRYGRQYVILA